MRIDDLRISTRLELGFGVLGLMILAMVAVVWVQVSPMTGLFGDVANARIPRMVVGSAIKEDVQPISSSVRNMILMRDSSAILAEAQSIGRVQKRIDQRFGELEKLLADDGAAQAALQQVQAARKAYEPLQNETQELAGSGQIFEAKDILIDKMHPAQQVYFSAMDALLQQQQQQLGQATGATEQAANRVRGMLLVTTLVVMVLGGLLAW